MRKLLGALNMHCIKQEATGDEGQVWPRTVVCASWLWQKLSNAEYSKYANSMKKKGIRVVTLDGIKWRFCWFVLDVALVRKDLESEGESPTRG